MTDNWMIELAVQFISAAIVYSMGRHDGRRNCAERKPKKYNADVSWPHDRDH